MVKKNEASEIEKENIIKTSKKGWIDEALKAYTRKIAFNLVDDAELGLSEKDVKSAMNLLAFMKKERK